MARKGGLPKNIIAKYGISKKAWAVYRHGGGKTRRNPKRGAHKAHRATHRRRSRKNPTGYPFSGASYRPHYRARGGGYGDRPVARALPRFIRHARIRRSGRRKTAHRVGRHRARRNPAMGFGSSNQRGAVGNIRNMIPLTRRADYTVIWNHKIGSLVVGAGSFFVGGIAASSGGSIAVFAEGFIVAIVLRYVLKGKPKYAFVAPAWAAGAVVAGIANIVSTGSLTGSARLGDTMTNLKTLAAQVKVFGLSPPVNWGLKGVGLPGLGKGLNLKALGLPSLGKLRGLGAGPDATLSQTTLTGPQGQSNGGWTYTQ